ncbi:MAG: response regulator, partial [Desulfobulbaceae bacterium]|nr:response regulator [Desulfobulbaceae bacterium]
MTDTTARILIIDDEAIALQNLIHVLGKEGYEVVGSQNSTDALEQLKTTSYDLVLTDLKMEKVDGMEILKCTKEHSPDTEVIMITGYATVSSAIEAMKLGAYHYIAKPFKLDEVRKVVREALEKVNLKRENSQLKVQLSAFTNDSGILTSNKKMKSILTLSAQAATSDSNIVINGESGTGKELFARFIHSQSR